jgi:hypothetical protein
MKTLAAGKPPGLISSSANTLAKPAKEELGQATTSSTLRRIADTLLGKLSRYRVFRLCPDADRTGPHPASAAAVWMHHRGFIGLWARPLRSTMAFDDSPAIQTPPKPGALRFPHSRADSITHCNLLK